MHRIPVLLIVIGWPAFTMAVEPIRFGRDVLPILSENCFACHGPDESHRKADLRLDTRDGALTVLSLKKPAESELLVRARTTEPTEVMPPPTSHKKPLTPQQIATLQRWIEAGAPWGKHWSFERPIAVAPPKLSPHPIDAFVRDRLAKEGLKPSPIAARPTLARRVSLDITGLSPTVAELDAFLRECGDDPSGMSNAAYERWVDRLLSSKHFGERMAMWWLDAARYSDTDGFQGDDTRTNWPWRDWVIDSFNRNLPFDQFTIEQFAGDLLPRATPEQRLATCFHRNHMTNGEGGRDPEESRVDYVIDRINTVGTLWLGLTLGCCQCHTHKYDPITHREYYSLAAFFNSIDEDGKAGKAAKPYLAYQSPYAPRAVEELQKLVTERKARELHARQSAEQPFAEWLNQRNTAVRSGFTAWHLLRAAELTATEGTRLSQEPDGTIQATGPNPRQDDYRLIAPVKLSRITGLKLEVLPHASLTRGGLSRGASGEFILTDIKVQVRRKGNSQLRDILVTNAVASASAAQKDARSYGDIKGTLDDDPRNGWTTKGHGLKQSYFAVFALAEPLILDSDEELVFVMLHRSTDGDANIGRFRVFVTDQAGPAVRSVEPAPLEQLSTAKPGDLAQLDTKLRAKLFDQFLADYAPYLVEKAAHDRTVRQLTEVQTAAKSVNVMVLTERVEPRPTHVLIRGVWDKKGEVVSRDVPAVIAPWGQTGPRTREQFARWIVSRDNPLTARVFVNHVWQLLFGAGLVRTPDDFGLLGERPTHPELLDWLAVDFQEHGWDVKRLIRLIVTSETYKQSSAVSPELLARDPENRLLARASRFRLPSWMLRDAALQASGLLNPAIGGPPVRPYQPQGVWEEMFMGRFQYEPSEGLAQNRRTVYAFWRRAIAPTFLFDSAQRRVCEVRQTRTNTPLQALTLLNDPNYLAASRALAAHALQSSQDPTARLTQIMQRVVSRTPSSRDLTILRRELDRARAHYRKHPEDAKQWLREIPGARANPTESASELAAYTLVASMILNLDEAINHE